MYLSENRWSEQDPYDLIHSVKTCISEATEKFIGKGHATADIKTIGLTNQRETTVVWDGHTGEPLHNAISWTDTRTAALVRKLKEREGASKLQETCGLPLSTYSSSVKLRWLIDNVDVVRTAYDESRLAFGTIDTWLLSKLTTSGMEHDRLVTDVTNASRTMLLSLHTLEYDNETMRFFGFDPHKITFPTIVPSSDPTAFGRMSSGPLLDTPVTGCLGDQSAALVGQGGIEPGMAKNTYGTGCFLLQNVGERPVSSEHGLLATVAYDLGQGIPPAFALEGSIATAGSAIRFLSSNLGFFGDAGEIDRVAGTVQDNGGLVFVTAFSGLFAPYWIDNVKGTICKQSSFQEPPYHRGGP